MVNVDEKVKRYSLIFVCKCAESSWLASGQPEEIKHGHNIVSLSVNENKHDIEMWPRWPTLVFIEAYEETNRTVMAQSVDQHQY